MADNTHIEWTDATWNPITGCAVVSPGCTNCYAMGLAGTRLQHHPSRAGLTTDTKAGPVWTGEVRFNEEWLAQPLRWRRPRKIFVCAHGDLFAEGVPDAWINRVFAIMALAPQHTFQVLTKRPARMRAYVDGAMPFVWREAIRAGDEHGATAAPFYGAAHAHDRRCWPLPNVWLGVSAEDQRRADERIPLLLDTQAALRFVSAEPLLGPLDLACYLDPLDHGGINLDWVIAGGESGPKARPMHPAWARQIRDACAAAGVAFHFKQWGTWAVDEMQGHPRGDYIFADPGSRHRSCSDAVVMAPIGKKAAGRHLDGRTHDGMPEARPC